MESVDSARGGPGRLTIHHADNLYVLAGAASGSVDLIYIDPPFNTGRVQRRTQVATMRDDGGDRTGHHGARYRTVKIGTRAYPDFFDDYLAFLEPRFEEARRVLKPDGSPGQDTHGHMVAHLCEPERPREDRVSDPEAARDLRPHRERALQAGRPADGFFAGSGSFGESAAVHRRHRILVDNHNEAMQVMTHRFAGMEVEWIGWNAEEAAVTG